MTALAVEAHIVVPDAGTAADWYRRAFGGSEESRVPLPGGRVLSVVIRIGTSRVHLGSELPEAGVVFPASAGGTSTVLQIETDDARSLWSRAIGAGADVRHDLADRFWGELHGQIADPFGLHWNIAERVRDVSDDEIAAAAAQAFAA
jgi:PhnB protein